MNLNELSRILPENAAVRIVGIPEYEGKTYMDPIGCPLTNAFSDEASDYEVLDTVLKVTSIRELSYEAERFEDLQHQWDCEVIDTIDLTLDPSIVAMHIHVRKIAGR